MKPRGYPFVALVGLDTLKLGLQLAAIDARLSVLIRGDKAFVREVVSRVGVAGFNTVWESPHSPILSAPAVMTASNRPEATW